MALLWGWGCRSNPHPPARISVIDGRADGGIDAGAAAPPGGDPADLGTAAGRDTGPRLPAAAHEITLSPGESATITLTTEATLGQLDVFLHMDTTSSMGEEIDALQRDLLDLIVPALAAQVPDVAFGVGRFEDFPVAPFGDPGHQGRADTPFALLSPITDDLNAIREAVFALDNPLGQGGDGREAGAEALFQVATGAGLRSTTRTYIDPFVPTASSLGRRGGVGFRDHALPVVLHITDAPSHAPGDYGGAIQGTHDLQSAIAALKALDARVIGVVSRDCEARACTTDSPHPVRDELLAVAHATTSLLPQGSPCTTGPDGALRALYHDTCPLVFDVGSDGRGLTSVLVDGTVALLSSLSFKKVEAVASGDPLAFVQRIEAQAIPQAAGQPVLQLEDRRPLGAPDGVADTLLDVHHGAKLAFAVTLTNTHIDSQPSPQSFRVQLRIQGDGLTLSETLVRVHVPASTRVEPPVNGADGGWPQDASTPTGSDRAP